MQLQAWNVDKNDDNLVPYQPPGFSWSVTGGGTVSTTGLYTAGSSSSSPVTVTASAGGKSGTATFYVAPSPTAALGCSSAPKGVWQNVTPPQLNWIKWCTPAWSQIGDCTQPGDTNVAGQLATYGAHYITVDHANPGTVLLGTSSLGLWKITDCGASATQFPTNTDNGRAIASGRNWTIAIDPTDSKVIYTNSGYSFGGVYKTTDGGTTWDEVLHDGQTGGINSGTGAFIEKITIDPTPVTGHVHLLASFHAPCTGPAPAGTPMVIVSPATSQSPAVMGWGCMAESYDSGTHWHLTTAPVWSGYDGPGQTMVDATHWFYSTNTGDGVYLTTTGGVIQTGKASAWDKVLDGGANGAVYVAPDGNLYSGGSNLSYASATKNSSGQYNFDANMHWTTVPNSPSSGSYNGSNPLVEVGSTLYISNFFEVAVNSLSPTGGTFTALPAMQSIPPASVAGATLDYDSVNRVIYSNNMWNGVWRYFIP